MTAHIDRLQRALALSYTNPGGARAEILAVLADMREEAPTVTRYAVVRTDSADRLRSYLPENYSIVSVHANPSGYDVLIEGEDAHGWTLDDYVLPRLASGLMFGSEYPTYLDATEAAAAAMN